METATREVRVRAICDDPVYRGEVTFLLLGTPCFRVRTTNHVDTKLRFRWLYEGGGGVGSLDELILPTHQKRYFIDRLITEEKLLQLLEQEAEQLVAAAEERAAEERR